MHFKRKGNLFIMATVKTSKAKTKAKTDTTGAEVKAAITITETEVEHKQKQAHNVNMAKAAKTKGYNIEQGKPLNDKTYEYVCDDCLDIAASDGNVFCLYDEVLKNTGRCACGKLTTNKAILI